MSDSKNVNKNYTKVNADEEECDFMQDISMADLMGFGGFGKLRNHVKSYVKVIKESKVNIIKPETEEQPVNIDSINSVEQPAAEKMITSESDSAASEEESSEDIDYAKFPEKRVPCSNSLSIPHGDRLVSGISVDNSGSRLVSVGFDFNFRMYDFATMDSKLNAFRIFEPLESHHLRTVRHSPASDLILITGSCAQIKLVDRDGKTVSDCMKGDQYLIDMGQTKGHVTTVNSASWNPIDIDKFVSCGMDSTVRIWSVEASDSSCKRVIKVKNPQGKNVSAVDVIYNYAGTLIYGSCMDGSIQVWDPKRSTGVPIQNVRNAHQPDNPAYSICMNRNDYTLSSRGFDDSLKLWDIRQFKDPVFSIPSLPNSHDTTRVIFSPDNRMVITGTSEKKGKINSFLNFYNISNMSLVLSIPFEDCSAIAPFWHPKINQLFVSCSDGTIRAFFDPLKSRNGVLLCMTKVHKHKIDIGESMITEQVITPYARQQEGREMTNVSMRKLQIKARKDPILTRKPAPPVYGPGQGGRLTTGMSLSAFVCKQMVITGPEVEANPREEILKYAQLAEEDPYFVTPAYEKTQPTKIFREFNSDSDGEKDPNKKKKTKES